MSIYKCNNCNKEFKLKTDLIRHENRKFKCKTVNLDDNIILNNDSSNLLQNPPYVKNTPPITPIDNVKNLDDNDNYKCNKCYKIFSRSDNYNRHMLYHNINQYNGNSLIIFLLC